MNVVRGLFSFGIGVCVSNLRVYMPFAWFFSQ